tara:strand:+ start:66 stop:950 length:885 start_codon:yes stop_codon:yes gene_type:complete
MKRSPLLLAAALLLAAPARADEESDAAAEHEARAQKMLSDSLVDAMAMLEHGSEAAKEQAARSVAQLAIETTISQPFHPVTFRNACVRAGIIKQLASLLKDPNATPTSYLHALHALEAIATDDPTTDMDNGHAQAVCSTGVCPTVVSFLASADEALQVSAARCAAILAEDPQCQQMLVRAKAVDALVFLGTYGNDMAKMHAVAALDLLRLNNVAASKQIRESGGMQMLSGLKQYGLGGLRDLVSEQLDSLQKPSAVVQATVEPTAHVKQAHLQRVKHSKMWESVGVRRAYAPPQ